MDYWANNIRTDLLCKDLNLQSDLRAENELILAFSMHLDYDNIILTFKYLQG
jgi:hypothetical protein